MAGEMRNCSEKCWVKRPRQKKTPLPDCCTVLCTQSVFGYLFHALVVCGPRYAHICVRLEHLLMIKITE